MSSYDELLYELGELPAVVQNASPFSQLILLITFNTALFVCSEFLRKFFGADVLYVLAGLTGRTYNAQQPNDTTPAPPPMMYPRAGGVPGFGDTTSMFSAFSANFK